MENGSVRYFSDLAVFLRACPRLKNKYTYIKHGECSDLFFHVSLNS
ncbi:hypothetical protein C1A50_1890 [Paenibacillus polymyxa]|nr:hypothetical protein C1A50_1890 [Paenibacillus polymyxa]